MLLPHEGEQPTTSAPHTPHASRSAPQGLRERYETHHKLRYTDESLMAAAKFSSQYISDRFLPDKASGRSSGAAKAGHGLLGEVARQRQQPAGHKQHSEAWVCCLADGAALWVRRPLT